MSRDHSCETCGRGGMNDRQDAEISDLRDTIADLTTALENLLDVEPIAEVNYTRKDKDSLAGAASALARAKEVSDV